MTSSSSSQQPPENWQSLLRRRLLGLVHGLIHGLSMSQYNKVRREAEEKSRQKIDENQKNKDALKKKLQELFNGFDTKELDEIVDDFIKDKLAPKEEQAETKKKAVIDKLREIERTQIRASLKALREYKRIEPELLKIRALIIITPAILVGFSFFFRDRINDVMSIDALETRIDSLEKERTDASKPTQGQGTCSPGGFFSC